MICLGEMEGIRRASLQVMDMPRYAVAAWLCWTAFCGGCQRPSLRSITQSTDTTETAPVTTGSREPSGSQTAVARGVTAREDRPSPSAVCGHAVAFAGWKPAGDGARDLVLVFDPGDNRLEERSHVWNGKPREVPLHFGSRRPTLVLLSAGVFTVTGAVVIVPAVRGPTPPRFEATIASGMPDLSQDLNPRWPGLCGPTAAADILYSLHSRGRPVLDGFERGPGVDADQAVERLVVGGQAEIAGESLAGRMGIGPDGDGATNEGLKDGCLSWLDESDPGNWAVELLWFDDARKTVKEQRAFVGRLAAALEAGGGAILCLWPGSEFSDAEAGEAMTDTDSGGKSDSAGATAAKKRLPPRAAQPPRPAGAPELPAAEFPKLPAPPADARPALPGRPRSPADDPGIALATARDKRRAAESRLDRGDVATALALATQGVQLLVEPSRVDNACREELDRLLAVCKAVEARMPPAAKVGGDRPTVYE
jgi:hypothetical protein